jgi:hypothetical protein
MYIQFNAINNDGAIFIDVTISASSNAWKAHQVHGDVMGACPGVSNGRFSGILMRRRNDYYGTIVNGQEQVLYSQSIPDYALERLTASRLQLDQYRNSGMPADELREKETAVVELEQNASLLDSLASAAAFLSPNGFKSVAAYPVNGILCRSLGNTALWLKAAFSNRKLYRNWSLILHKPLICAR